MALKSRKVIVAAVQAAPALPMDKRATTEKACELIDQAGRNGAQLVAFPETFIPMFPNWSVDLERPNEWAVNLADLTEESVEVPSEETDMLCKAAKRAGTNVCMGMNERHRNYRGMIYNSLLYISAEGEILGTHRKLTPSHRERVMWGRGDARDIMAVFNTNIGKVGGLICYEHLQPLYRYAMAVQGEEIHCACWPGGWPYFPPPGRTNKELTQISSRQYAIETQSFVVLSSSYIPTEMADKANLGNAHWGFRGGSAIIDPSGNYVVEPVYDQETIIYAEIDLADIIRRKAYIDPVGRDARWDVLRLDIATEPFEPVAGGKSLLREQNESSNLKELERKVDSLTEKLEQLAHKLEK